MRASKKPRLDVGQERDQPQEDEPSGPEGLPETRPQIQQQQIQMPKAFDGCFDTIAQWMAGAILVNNSEIEGKIGFLVPERKDDNLKQSIFESRIDPAAFIVLMGRCYDPEAKWDKIEQETTETYLFEGNIRGTKYGNKVATFVHKMPKVHHDLVINLAESTPQKPCIRLSHNLEVETKPPCAQPYWVRLRKRHSFYRGEWRFDLTFVKEGDTQQKAMETPAHHEVEMEYLRPETASRPANIIAAEFLLNLEILLCDCLSAMPEYASLILPASETRVKIARTLTITTDDEKNKVVLCND